MLAEPLPLIRHDSTLLDADNHPGRSTLALEAKMLQIDNNSNCAYPSRIRV